MIIPRVITYITKQTRKNITYIQILTHSIFSLFLQKIMSNYHVAVLAFPFATHAGLLHGLVQRLANTLPNVTFTFFNTSKSNSLIFSNQTDPHCTNLKPFDISDGVPEGYAIGEGGIEELIGLFFKSAKNNFQNAISAAEDETGKKITCVFADAFIWFSGEIAEELGVDWIPVWTSAAGSLSVHIYTDFIRENVGVQGIFSFVVVVVVNIRIYK